MFFFGSSEVNSTKLITSELTNQRARKALFTCVVYTKDSYLVRVSAFRPDLHFARFLDLDIWPRSIDRCGSRSPGTRSTSPKSCDREGLEEPFRNKAFTPKPRTWKRRGNRRSSRSSDVLSTPFPGLFQKKLGGTGIKPWERMPCHAGYICHVFRLPRNAVKGNNSNNKSCLVKIAWV